MPTHDLVGDIQAKARALSYLLGGKERLEDVVHHVFRYSGTIVLTFKDHEVFPLLMPGS